MDLVVTEGIVGYWHYHISDADKRLSRALCGADVMYTSIPLDAWGIPFGEHFPKHPTWCEDCAKFLEKENVNIRSEGVQARNRATSKR